MIVNFTPSTLLFLFIALCTKAGHTSDNNWTETFHLHNGTIITRTPQGIEEYKREYDDDSHTIYDRVGSCSIVQTIDFLVSMDMSRDDFVKQLINCGLYGDQTADEIKQWTETFKIANGAQVKHTPDAVTLFYKNGANPEMPEVLTDMTLNIYRLMIGLPWDEESDNLALRTNMRKETFIEVLQQSGLWVPQSQTKGAL